MFGFKKDKVEIVDFQKELKRRERNEAIKNGWNSFALFVRENSDVLIPVGGVALTVFGGGVKVLSKIIAKNTAEREIRFKETTIYDRSQGRYVQLKRALRSSEALEIERRRTNGEKLNSILYDMNLLKK